MNKPKTPKPKKYRQNTQVKEHYHPRWLARNIARKSMERDGRTGINKVVPGTEKSAFARLWRSEAEMLAK